ncbi:cytochrome P450 [Halorientalis pallida]|uniref:Cytochrome P450 n=1 Tax=Halorientalis pallida TaxID=2479928 RepID=A0A498KZD5_9EURY|nr:cytochrome P450 [Halorientalis pallida]RXK46290.1 cytochrome P450 [Halorientalis pallida]
MASDADQGARSGGVTESPTDAPLAPYPPNCGPPWLHFVHQMREPLAFAEEALATRDVVRMNLLGNGDIYGVGHPDHAKRVLLTEREQFRKTEDFRIAFGEGLLTVEGEEWQRQRDVLQPLFTRDSVMDYADGMVEQVQRRIDRWRDGDRLDLQAEFTDLALDVLFATVLGRELALDGDRELRESAAHLHDWFKPTSYFLPEWVPTPARRRFRAAKETIRAEADRLLAEKAGGGPTDPAAAEDLLSLLVGLREAGVADSAMLTDERLRDQMVTMIFAGHDTTTTTLTFSFWALANNPEVRERFHAEVDALDGPPTLDELAELDVTERVVTETLRLYPPVHSLPRETTTDVVFDGHRIPADERVLVGIRHVQRDPRFYDDPEQFRPSRWDGDLRSDLHDFAYAPFGGGPRICIGRQFALLEAKLTLATIGQQYDLGWLGENDADGEPPVSPEMTLRMEPGQEFLVTER